MGDARAIVRPVRAWRSNGKAAVAARMQAGPSSQQATATFRPTDTSPVAVIAFMG